MYKPIAFIVPDNFSHKAGDGLKTRKHHLKDIHPALQAQPGGTQLTLCLCIKEEHWNKCKTQINFI